jgi:hypothetical protein
VSKRAANLRNFRRISFAECSRFVVIFVEDPLCEICAAGDRLFPVESDPVEPDAVLRLITSMPELREDAADLGSRGAENEALTQMRATRFGEYGRQINELYMSVELDGVLGSWEDAQTYAAEHFNITAPEGYDAIKDKTCYRAVFEIARQSGDIDAAQLVYLSRRTFVLER